MSVTKYEVKTFDLVNGVMQETSDGEYTTYLEHLGRLALETDEVFALRQRCDRLEKALIKLRDCDWTISLPDRMDAVREIAREALAEDGKKK